MQTSLPNPDNATARYRFTILVPFFNEQENIEALSHRLAGYVRRAPMAACVLFIDDGSTDRGLELVRAACLREADFYYLALERNGGLSGALKAGIDHTRSEYAGYIDADLQTAPEDFDLLLPLMGACDLATGIRSGRRDGFFKRLQSRIANGFRRMMTHDAVADTGCPLKVMRTSLVRQIPFFDGMHRFLPALVLMEGGRVEQVPVRHFPRTAGRSKYHLWNRLAGPLADCFAYRWMKKRRIGYRIAEGNL